MAGETVITVVGNLVDDPELRFTPSGAAVANFRIASTPRIIDRQTNEWKDGEGLFLSCAVWRQAAENVAESLQKGMRVVVQGRLKQRSYETREGEKRTVFELDVEEVGPSAEVRHREGHPHHPSGGGGGYSGGGGGPAGRWAPQGGGRPAPAATTRGPPRRRQAARAAAVGGGSQGGGGAQQGGGQRPVGRPRRGLRRAPVLTPIDQHHRSAPPIRIPQPFRRSNHSGPGF